MSPDIYTPLHVTAHLRGRERRRRCVLEDFGGLANVDVVAIDG